MAFFEECDNTLNYIIGEKILTNQKICKLLYYYSDKNPKECDGEMDFDYNPLIQPDIQNTRQLLMKHIYPVPKNPDLQTEQTGLMTVVLSGGERRYGDNNLGYRRIYIIFDIMIHLNQWIIEDSFRVYKIAEELDRMFNNVNHDKIGKTNYVGFKQRDYSNHFYGIQLIYDFSTNSNIECNPKSEIFNTDKKNDEENNCKVCMEDTNIQHTSFLPKNLGVKHNGNV